MDGRRLATDDSPQKAREHHPDVNQHNPNAAHNFIEITNAYEVFNESSTLSPSRYLSQFFSIIILFQHISFIYCDSLLTMIVSGVERLFKEDTI